MRSKRHCLSFVLMNVYISCVCSSITISDQSCCANAIAFCFHQVQFGNDGESSDHGVQWWSTDESDVDDDGNGLCKPGDNGDGGGGEPGNGPGGDGPDIWLHAGRSSDGNVTPGRDCDVDDVDDAVDIDSGRLDTVTGVTHYPTFHGFTINLHPGGAQKQQFK